MEKIDIEEIATFVQTISKNKRFSHLSHTELCDLWKGICKYLGEQLHLKKVRAYPDFVTKKSINLHGIGSFFTRKAKKLPRETGLLWSLHFSPSKAWDKLPGFQIDKTIVVGTSAAESLNLAAVAVNAGLTRETVEAGVKDIVNGLTSILRKGANVSLTMGSLGKLNFYNHDITFKFISSFIKAVNDDSLRQKRPIETLVPLEKPSVKEEAEPVALQENKLERKNSIAIVEHNPLPIVISENENKLTKNPLAPISEKTNANENETRKLTFDLDEAANKLQNLEELIEKTFSKESNSDDVHTHFYSGNRLWKNSTCPICKTGTTNIVVDLNAVKKAEKENDKMLLHISLEIDKEYLDKKKDREMQRHQNSLETAQYNHKVSIESQQKVKEKLPMGDLFEKRKIQPPIMSPSQMAEGIHDQILAKRERNERSAKIHAAEDKLVCEKLKKEIKAAEMQAHLMKTKKCQQMHASLAEQIRINRSLKEKENNSGPDENPFARSETLLALYQREKAKQLYYEQLAIVRQKRDYARKIADLDKKHSLNRLDIARKELQKDFKTIKKENFEVRRSLESYWSNQLLWKEKLKKQLELEV